MLDCDESVFSYSHRLLALLAICAWHSQAIDKLEIMLDGGMKTEAGGKTNMFGPKEYVQIYT